MSWGKGLLDDDAFQEQQQEARKAEQTWGRGFDLPNEEEEVVDAAAPAAAVVTADPPPPDLGMSVATLEQRLAEDPSWWPEALQLEAARPAPRKSALRAIRRTAQAESADATILASLDTLLAESQ